MDILEITSRDNTTFKELLKLTDKKWRRRFGKCILEGDKIVRENLYRAEKVFLRKRNLYIFKDVYKSAVVLEDGLFDLVSSLENDTGVLAVIKIPIPKVRTYPYLVLDGIQDSGNMGTIFRTATAFGFGTVYCIGCVDAWSPKVLRASSGISFALNIIECSVTDFIKPNGSILIGAGFNGEKISPFIKTEIGNFGIVLGNEGQGISTEIGKTVDKWITIPMKDGVESLNVAVAGGILMYSLKGEAL